MSKTLRWIFGIIGILLIAAVLFWAGFFFGRASWGVAGFWPMNMMGRFVQAQPGQVPAPFGYRTGPGMMGYFRGDQPGSTPDSYGFPIGPGMMGGGYGGMMGGYSPGGLSPVEPLSLDRARQAVTDYLAGLGNSDLALKEVMIFDNHAYAEIVEMSTGIGAMEVLVDPVTLAVYPEHGPNMMWNLKYGMMAGAGGYGMMGSMGMGSMGMGPMGMGGMMGGYPRQPGNAAAPQVSAEMPVTAEQAVEAAQRYLDQYLSGATVEDHADQFYGYYTLHILRDGETIGMLSVNGYSSQVFPHTWHGDFIEMSEEE